MRPLILIVAALAASAPAVAQKRIYPFQIDRAGEAVADIVMSSPGSDWGRPGREAAMVDVRVDSGAAFQVMLYAGPENRKYPVFLGWLEPGQHQLSIERNVTFSAPRSGLAIADVAVRGGITDPVLAHAPVLYARRNTIGRFSDVPLVVYAEKITGNGAGLLQYTVIFSNEDGGTSTRALMARWGRTTDIEYVYRVNPATGKGNIQTREHKDVEFAGKRERSHPLLIPVTDNNMVADEIPSAVRYQIAPLLVDLSKHSREQVMDDDPITYRIATREMDREGKLRPFGIIDGQKISDPSNYVYVEADITVEHAGVITLLRLKYEPFWRSSALGRIDYSVDRSGWIRTTVELPPGAHARDIAEIGFTCVVMPEGEKKKMPDTGTCRVNTVTKAFFLDPAYRPGPSFWSTSQPVEVPAGEFRIFRVEPKS